MIKHETLLLTLDFSLWGDNRFSLYQIIAVVSVWYWLY